MFVLVVWLTYVLILIPVVEFSLFHLDFRFFVLGGKTKKGGLNEKIKK